MSNSRSAGLDRKAAIARDARGLTFLAGLLGLAPAAGLGALALVPGGHPGGHPRSQLFGIAAMTLVYMSPFILTLALARYRDPAARGGMLLALGVLSLAASFSTFSLVTVVFLPATGAIFLAAAWTLRLAGPRVRRVVFYFLVGLGGAAIIGYSFFSLFGLEADQPACWTVVRQGVPSYTCASDIVTGSEAAKGLAILAVGATIVLGVPGVRPLWVKN